VTDLSSIVKAYDIRGLVPQQLDASVAKALGAAFARFVGGPTVVIARDMRESGVELSKAFADGVNAQGVDVVDAGLGSTDLLYYAAGSMGVPGARAAPPPARRRRAPRGRRCCGAGSEPGRGRAGRPPSRGEP
jgi:phosphomannomutase